MIVAPPAADNGYEDSNWKMNKDYFGPTCYLSANIKLVICQEDQFQSVINNKE